MKKDIKINNDDNNEKQTTSRSTRKYTHYKKRTFSFYLKLFSFLILCILFIALPIRPKTYNKNNPLSDYLNIPKEFTHSINQSDHNSGIKMTADASHICQRTAVILFTFEKEDNSVFQPNFNPTASLLDANGKSLGLGNFNTTIFTKQSEDKKRCHSYYIVHFPKKLPRNKVNVTLSYDTLSWKVSIPLKKDNDNSLTLYNKQKEDTITAFYQELEFEKVIVTDMAVIIPTTSKKVYEITANERQKELFSSISPDSSRYYGIDLELIYDNDTTSQKNSFYLNEENELISYFTEPIPKEHLIKVQIKDIVLPIE